MRRFSATQRVDEVAFRYPTLTAVLLESVSVVCVPKDVANVLGAEPWLAIVISEPTNLGLFKLEDTDSAHIFPLWKEQCAVPKVRQEPAVLPAGTAHCPVCVLG